MIEVRNVWKKYGDQVVLEQLNLSIKEGEFCSMVGASGCGKSTFLRMLLGQEQPSKGALLLDGKPLPSEPGRDRGVVFQRYSVFEHLSVLRNVLIGLELPQATFTGRLFGARRRAAMDVAVAMLERVGLKGAMDKYPSQLSGGMQQRLAIAQALVMKPRILLLDEPFGALDPGIRKDMHELLLSLWRETGLTILMVTHDLKEGFTLGSRVLVFDKVRIDPQAPMAYGARITYNIALDRSADSQSALSSAQVDVACTASVTGTAIAGTSASGSQKEKEHGIAT